MIRLVLATAFLLVGSAAAIAQAEQKGPSALCALIDTEERTVVRVIDGETLILEGGSELKLVGALSPRAYDASGEASDWPLAEQARLTLERIAGGRGIRVAFAGQRHDRYGRMLGHAFLSSADGLWIQGEMLKRGMARAYALEASTACLPELIAHEAIAREAAIGLWAEPVYAVRSADDTRSLLRLAGTFQIVEGQVLGVSELRGSIFINFGEDWRQDFTAVIKAASRKQSRTIDTQSATGLKGQRIRVRGWVERRGGPMIELPHAASIEILQAAASESDDTTSPTTTQPRRRARTRRQGQPTPATGE